MTTLSKCMQSSRTFALGRRQVARARGWLANGRVYLQFEAKECEGRLRRELVLYKIPRSCLEEELVFAIHPTTHEKLRTSLV